jgi:23S rRNA pseudouridine1911/1915/1917 synthase
MDEFAVSPGEEGIRLDVFCASRLVDLSRTRVQKLIRDGRVLVDSVPRPPGYALRSGETVRIERPAPIPTSPEPVPQQMPIRVTFEDDDIIVINKDPGIVVHPAAGNRDGTLVNALLGWGARLSTLGGRDRPGVVHRLDKDTSGLIVFAKTDRAHKALAEQITARRIRKTYHALTWGHLGVASMRIDSPIARHPVHRQRMAVTPRGGRDASTEVFVVDTFEHFDYIRVITVTGRTHQIRVHLSSISHPILGDSVYGGRRAKDLSANAKARSRMSAILKLMQRQALHASKLGFAHPGSGRWMEFKTSLPADMRSVLEVLYREERV